MDNTKNTQLKSITLELEQLYAKAQSHINEQVSAEKYIYTSTYGGWVNEYNQITKRYNLLTSANLSLRNVLEHDLSSTHKTVRTEIAKSFAQSIKDLSEKLNKEVELEQDKKAPIPLHQMRRCFKIGTDRCPLNPAEKKNKLFIAIPFNDDYKDSFDYGIKIVLEQTGTEYYKADVEINNKDIMCKICNELQSCGKMIANISGYNPNVMLELGLAYGLGKSVIVIKDKKTTAMSDLGSVEYIEYSHAGDLQQKLFSIFR